MRQPVLPTRFISDASGSWIVADGWVLHGKSFNQRDGTQAYDPDSNPSVIGDSNSDVEDGSLTPGESITDSAAGGSASASGSDNAGVIGSAVATVAASATATQSSTMTSIATATGTAVVAGHNVGTSTSTSSSPSYSPTDLPNGWEPGPVRTAYYTVPLIIALTILLSIFIVGTIAVCVWRNQRKKQRLAHVQATKTGDGGGDMDGEMWLDIERLRKGVEKEMEKRRKKDEKEARKDVRTWLGAESKWRARLMLRKRGGKRRKGTAATTEVPEGDIAEGVSSSVDGSRSSSDFVRSNAPSPSSPSDENVPQHARPSSSPTSPSAHANPPPFPPSTSSSRPPSPSPSITAIRPPAYPASPAYPSSFDSHVPQASTSGAPPRQTGMYPDLPPSPPTPPPGLRTLIVPSRAHIATDDKRVLARMGRATFPRSSIDDPILAPDVPQWTDEEAPLPNAPPRHPFDENVSMVEEDYTPLPPRPRSIAPEDELFSFSGSNLPPPPPAFQHAVELDPAVPFDPGLGYTTQPISEVASAPFADWDEYGEASAPPLEESDDELDASESSASVPPPPPEETERRQQ